MSSRYSSAARVLLVSAVVGSAGIASAAGPIAPPRREVPGYRFDLETGKLFVPAAFRPDADGRADLVVFFHGAAWCAEQGFEEGGRNAALLTVNVPGFGYADRFSDPAVFPALLDDVTARLDEAGIATGGVGRVCLASFSGGYGAVREIIRGGAAADRVTDVVLADSLYGPIVDDGARLADDAVAPFLAYARRAADGEVRFFFSHLYPPEEKHRGNKTTLAARALIEGVGVEPRDADEVNGRGARLLYRADRGGFHVLGYSGMTTQDHFEHFYGIGELFAQTSLGPIGETGMFAGYRVDDAFGEQVRVFEIDPGVKVHVNAPPPDRFDPGLPTRLTLYALPNGNSTEWTIGRRMGEGMDWHFGIQHIGAQTRRVRELTTDRNLVVAYLEAEEKSWPAWKKGHDDAPARIRAIVDRVADEVPARSLTIHLGGHSGGGSFVFGFIDGGEEIPARVERISFLDSNYGFDCEQRHGAKLLTWLRGDDVRRLIVVAYDDREIELNGRKVVGPTGGTWRATHRMIDCLEPEIDLSETDDGPFVGRRGMDGRIDIRMHRNPENRILHTVLVGEMNGFIHTETLGTPFEPDADPFGGPAAYDRWIAP